MNVQQRKAFGRLVSGGTDEPMWMSVATTAAEMLTRSQGSGDDEIARHLNLRQFCDTLDTAQLKALLAACEKHIERAPSNRKLLYSRARIVVQEAFVESVTKRLLT